MLTQSLHSSLFVTSLTVISPPLCRCARWNAFKPHFTALKQEALDGRRSDIVLFAEEVQSMLPMHTNFHTRPLQLGRSRPDSTAAGAADSNQDTTIPTKASCMMSSPLGQARRARGARLRAPQPQWAAAYPPQLLTIAIGLLAGCSPGALTAAEIRRAIRADSTGARWKMRSRSW
mgnify:CR=1 FL=1